MHRIKTLLTEPQHSASISAAESPVLWQKFAVQNAGRPNAEYDRGFFLEQQTRLEQCSSRGIDVPHTPLLP